MQKKNWGWIIWQCTWGVIQTALGALLCFGMCRGSKRMWYKSCLVVFWGISKGLSLGLFLFVSDDALDSSAENPHHSIKHEYGHAVQSAILGPLYLILIGLPSFTWCNSRFAFKWRLAHNIDYYDFPTEKWADKLGEVNRYRD